MFVERWRAQLKDMDDEDNEFQFVMRNKIYPNGLFNLTSNPLFSIYSLTRKLKAINTILSSEMTVKRKSTYYDMHYRIVYFGSKYIMYHKADKNTKQVSNLPHDDCVSPRRCNLEVSWDPRWWEHFHCRTPHDHNHLLHIF